MTSSPSRVTNTSAEAGDHHLACPTPTSATSTGSATCDCQSAPPLGPAPTAAVHPDHLSGDFGGPDHSNTLTAVASDDDGNTDTEAGDRHGHLQRRAPRCRARRRPSSDDDERARRHVHRHPGYHQQFEAASTITALTDTYPLSIECTDLIGTTVAAGHSRELHIHVHPDDRRQIHARLRLHAVRRRRKQRPCFRLGDRHNLPAPTLT